MKRTPLKRKTAMKPGTKPMKRTRLAPIGKRGKRRQIAGKAALSEYVERFGFDDADGTRMAPCQVCGDPAVAAWLHPHHKKLRSQGGTEDHANLVAAHATCHLIFLHDGSMGLPATPWGRSRIDTCAADPASLANGSPINWSPQQLHDLRAIKRRTE
jgi:hypothetical protein